MDVFNDWSSRPGLGRKSKPDDLTLLAQRMGDALKAFQPPIVTVDCYDDVGYPWVRIVFDAVIAPRVVLELGAVLTQVAGTVPVYFNSLRPRSVLFVLDLTVEPRPDLPASRYGEPLSTLSQAWRQTAKRVS